MTRTSSKKRELRAVETDISITCRNGKYHLPGGVSPTISHW